MMCHLFPQPTGKWNFCSKRVLVAAGDIVLHNLFQVDFLPQCNRNEIGKGPKAPLRRPGSPKPVQNCASEGI
jgi:hypothetical protein